MRSPTVIPNLTLQFIYCRLDRIGKLFRHAGNCREDWIGLVEIARRRHSR